jgi:hypothetical protein
MDIIGAQVFDLHYADGSHLKGFNGIDQVWVCVATAFVQFVLAADRF